MLCAVHVSSSCCRPTGAHQLSGLVSFAPPPSTWGGKQNCPLKWLLLLAPECTTSFSLPCLCFSLPRHGPWVSWQAVKHSAYQISPTAATCSLTGLFLSPPTLLLQIWRSQVSWRVGKHLPDQTPSATYPLIDPHLSLLTLLLLLRLLGSSPFSPSDSWIAGLPARWQAPRVLDLSCPSPPNWPMHQITNFPLLLMLASPPFIFRVINPGCPSELASTQVIRSLLPLAP